MDGYEVARRLRTQAQLEKMKLTAVTGYGQDADRLKSREAGFDYHLVKPVDAQKLQEVLVLLMKCRKDRTVLDCILPAFKM